MATRLRLPKHDSLPEGVYFHKERPSVPEIVMQVPNADRTSSETYLIDLSDRENKDWFETLLRSKQLYDLLQCAGHAAYKPANGHCEELPDLDKVPRSASLIANAHRDMSNCGFLDRRIIGRLTRQHKTPPLMSALKRRL